MMEVGMGNEQLYYIQDTRQYVGNCMLLWCPNGAGYTTQLDEAGLYTREQVERLHRDTDRPWPREVLERHTVTHVRRDRVVGELGMLPGNMPPRDWLAAIELRLGRDAS